MNQHMEKFVAGEKLSARKLNRQLKQVVENRSYQTGVSAPTGHAPMEVRKINPSAVTSPYRFEVIQHPSDTTKVALRDGLEDVIVAATFESLPIAGGDFIVDPTDATLWLGNTAMTDEDVYYVYLEIEGDEGRGQITSPIGLNAYISQTAYPDEATLGYHPNTIKVLAAVNVDADGVLTITPHYSGEDIKVQGVVLDSVDTYNVANGEIMQSVTYDLQNRVGLVGFPGASTGKNAYAVTNVATGNSTLTWDWVCRCDGSDTNKITGLAGSLAVSLSGQFLNHELYDYSVGASHGQPAPGFSDLSGVGSGTTIDLWESCQGWWDNPLDPPIIPIHNHSNHEFTVDDHDTAGIDRYIINSGDASRNDFTGGAQLGDQFGIVSMSPDSRWLYSTDGLTPVVRYGTQALYSDGTSHWHTDNVATSYLDVTANSLYSKGGIGATNGIFATKGTSGIAAGYFTDGAVGAAIAGGSYGISTNGIISTSENNIEILISGDYYHLGSQGVTGDGFSGGIKTSEDDSDAHINSLIEHYL